MPSPKSLSNGGSRLLIAELILAAIICGSYGLLVLLSLGSGWGFPDLLPSRLDFAPWKHLAADRGGLASALGVSALMSMTVGISSTTLGLIIGRSIRRRPSLWGRWLIYWPFIISPVIAGTALYDLWVRLGLAGSYLGVMLAQGVFATGFAAVFFCEMWSSRTDRLEGVVRNLGGGNWAVWRHAILPGSAGLIFVCLVQTSLVSWLDYGLVSLIGGGNVPALTLKLLSYIREASVNQAALSALMLLTPALMVMAASSVLHLWERIPTTLRGASPHGD